MNRILTSFWIAVIAVALGSGCDPSCTRVSQSSTATNQLPTLGIARKADIERLLVPGMGTNRILSNLGEPAWVQTVSAEEQVWHHSLLFAEDEKRSNRVIGVTIGITNGNLAYWGYVTIGARSAKVVRRENVALNGSSPESPSLNFFVVNSSSNRESLFIDSSRFPKLGYIGSIPDLSISQVQEVSSEEREVSSPEGRPSSVWSFRSILSDEDAKRLSSLTRTSVFKTVLIRIGDEDVAAPTIVVPIETGSFAIEVTERSLAEKLAHLLPQMQKHRP